MKSPAHTLAVWARDVVAGACGCSGSTAGRASESAKDDSRAERHTSMGGPRR